MNYTINTFDWEYYIDEYIDLRNAGILTKHKAWRHWNVHGCKENRMNRKITESPHSLNTESITLDFKDYLREQNIKQIYVSNSLNHLKIRIMKMYNLQEYSNIEKPCVFFGIYDYKDELEKINQHKSKCVVMPGGSDFINYKFIKKPAIYLSLSTDIQHRFDSVKIPSVLIHFNLVDLTLFKPIERKGDKIFIYNSMRKKPDAARIYGQKYYDAVVKQLPNYEYIYSSDLNLPYEKMPEIYSQCFIGLRLTEHDGNANMVQEMEAMGIPVVHNQSDYGLKWKTVDDIVNIINSSRPTPPPAPEPEHEPCPPPGTHPTVAPDDNDDNDGGSDGGGGDRDGGGGGGGGGDRDGGGGGGGAGYVDNITIVINSYKPEKIDLLNAINSCLAQEKVDVIILISTVENDPTISYINNLTNDKIKLVISLLSEHPGKGQKGIFFQLNKALKEVKTRYFTYFSSNDIMYPTKLYNEIKLIEKNNSIFCFSRFESYFPKTNKIVKYSYSTDKMNLKKLLRDNYINDCATIDLTKFMEPLQFNYEKYGNTSYWHLWLTLLHKHGEGCMVINENVEWIYIRDDEKSQANQRTNDINKQELYKNQREFMLSEFDGKIKPISLYKYKNINEKFWWWNDPNNKKPVEMTVALPALNAKKIIWLALESLKNQINIDFAWELIVYEEEGISKSVVQSYVGKLPGCVRIIYKTITKDDAFYKLEDIKKNKCTSYYTLLEKWINMAKIADKNSKIFVKHAVDCYSSPKRLYIHYEHFKNDTCYYSTQPKGYFYNIKSDKWLLYNGYLREPVSWNPYFEKQVEINKDIKVTACHLNMALRTKFMRKIELPDNPKNRGIDGYILKNLCVLINTRPETAKIVFTDDEIDKDNWKYSIDTDGYNNISKRSTHYSNYTVKWYIPQPKYDYKLNKIHNEIIKKIKKKDYFIFVEEENTMNFFLKELIKNYDLKIYDSKNNNKDSLIIFGLYAISEQLEKVIKLHEGDIILIWCGSDINYPENQKSIKNINYIKTLNNKKITHLAMGGIIEKKIQYFFKKNPLFYPIAPTIILKNYKPIKKGKDIYTYINASNPRIYGFQIIEKLKQKHNDIVFHVCINPKNKKYCKRKNINTDNYESYEMDKVIDVYKKCFLCLRLTNIDGNANSVLETGLLGLKTVYIDDKVPSAITYDSHDLIWSRDKSSERNTKISNAVESISKIIENEKKNIGTYDKELSDKMKEYINWDFNKLNVV